MNIIEYLKEVRDIPEWDRVPAISDKELNNLILPPWDNPNSECYGCKKHSMHDCCLCSKKKRGWA